ncbi:uncharacterized protein LOC143680892 isoform X2 [Tamandua tetradactyla]|uniref:uncharacterized protein LOC143680892 isoform X2 n=1 Tax=Tamandua tetradactyla TaxID=48850 RepID=UPI004054954D
MPFNSPSQRRGLPSCNDQHRDGGREAVQRDWRMMNPALGKMASSCIAMRIGFDLRKKEGLVLLQRREMKAPAEPLAPGCRKGTEKGGIRRRRKLPGRMPAPDALGQARGSKSSVFWNATGACQGVLAQLLPKPLTAHPGQSHAGASS